MGDKFYYTNAASELMALNDGTNTFLQGFGDLGLQSVTVAGQRIPYTHGQVPKGLYTPSRTVTLVIDIIASTQSALETFEAAMRRHLNPYINTSTPGTLRLIRDNGTIRDLTCFCIQFSELSSDRDVVASKRAIIFQSARAGYANDPWWFDPTVQTQTSYVTASQAETFPLFDAAVEWAFAGVDIDDDVSINNEGDVPSYPTLVITGAADNVHYHNLTTGADMEITITMDANDILTINMEAATIMWWDNSGGTTTSKLDAMSAGSEFWALARGNNVVHVEASNATEATVTITWYNWYIGA